MGRLVRNLSVETLDDLPARCRVCLFWELSPAQHALAAEHDREFEKEAWCSEVTLVSGTCGRVAYRDGRPAGYALSGPPEAFAGAAAFPARISKDAFLLAALFVDPEHERLGIGRALVYEALHDAKERGKRALEAYGDRRWTHPACVTPESFLAHAGFRVHRDHVRYPLMRIDVRSLSRLAEEAEAAVEELLSRIFTRAPAGAPAPR